MILILGQEIHEFRMPSNFRFGVGAMKTLVEEIGRYSDVKKIAVITDKGLARVGIIEKITKILEPLSIPIVTYCEINGEPGFSLIESAVETLKKEKVDFIIGIGGGSSLDVAKAVAALLDKDDILKYLNGSEVIERRDIPCILLPTTSGTGSEMTKIAVFGDEEKELKQGIVSPALFADLALVDPELTLSSPPKVTASSGVDAFTHALESYISVNATELTKIYSEKAMELFPKYITRAVHHGADIEARIGMSWVSVLAGTAFANAGVGAVHALAYPLGGKYHIEHGVANALLMPYVFEVIGATRIDEMVKVASLLQLGDYQDRKQDALQDVVAYLYHLLKQLDLPLSLEELNVEKDSLPALAKQASQIQRLLDNTPYQLTEEKILKIYQHAFTGK